MVLNKENLAYAKSFKDDDNLFLPS